MTDNQITIAALFAAALTFYIFAFISLKQGLFDHMIITANTATILVVLAIAFTKISYIERQLEQHNTSEEE